MKKALSLGTSAALVAALLATAVAPSAFAANPLLTSAGNVAVGTTSAGTATLTLQETAADSLSITALPTTEHMYVDICDNGGFAVAPACVNPGTVSWAGTPVLSGNVASLGASVTLVGARLDIKITGRDVNQIETLIVSGLKITASSAAAPGDLKAQLSDTNGGLVWKAFYSASANAKGKLVNATGIGATTFFIALDTDSPCNFVAPAVGNELKIAGASAENVASATVSLLGATVPGQQDVAAIPAPGLTTSHGANDPVTQATGSCPALGTTLVLGAPATVVTAAKVTYDGPLTVYPGESNSPAGFINVTEPATPVGFLAKGTTLTYTIATAGVVFSGTPSVALTSVTGDSVAGPVFNGTTSTAVLSADRKSVVVTITAASTVAGMIRLYNITYDVASTVPGGTFVDVNVAASGSLILTGNPAENAVVFRGITGSAPTPTVYIGENNQKTGLVTLTEAAAGFFQAGVGSNNTIAVCTLDFEQVGYSFTFAPYMKVTTGDLLLRNGLVSAPVGTAVAGVWDGAGCYTWTVWAGSSVASTVVIGDSTFASGPIINVKTAQTPGIVALRVFSGNGDSYTTNRIATVGFAVAAYRNQVAVTALGQPIIPTGSKTKAGAIQIAETGIGQLKFQEDLCFEILPRASNGLRTQDTFMQALTTADLPVVTATGGVIVGPVSMYGTDCLDRQMVEGSTGIPPQYLQLGIGSGTHALSFSFDVYQQSTAGTGKVVVDNINLIATADAPTGAVLFNVYGLGGNPTNVVFQSTVSNAKIGIAPKLNIAANSALGLNPTSGYTAVTPKTQAVGKYVTWKFTGGKSLAGQRVNILVAKKFGGAWGGPVYYKSVWADANGIVTFAWTSKTAAAVNVRAQWPGTTAFAISTSKALGAYYK